MSERSSGPMWKPSACILCECNCGIEVQLGGEDGRRLTKIRGDRGHPSSRGYTCEKALRLDHYQNGRDRLSAPLRRRADGSYEPISWAVAIQEIARKLAAVRDQHGGERIFYYGGGGQGNHLPMAYAAATLNALGVAYRSNALAQEKTGEFWVSGRMFGAGTRGDFERCEVGVFLGKNPWQSHGIPRARLTLRELSRDPKRTMIVIDPRVSETAELADIHLRVRPGQDAFLMSALLGVIVQEGLHDEAWLAEHAQGLEDVLPALSAVPVVDYAKRSGVSLELIQRAARRIAEASSVAIYEDLGVQMNRHSTLLSYLNRLTWTLTGNFAKAGTHHVPTVLHPLAISLANRKKTTPVTGAKVIAGLVPCNVIAEEILTDHPARFRAMIVESANPAHSLADSAKLREAMRALEVSVVIDVAMSETARQADYVLPAATQFEKHEATFFNFDAPKNAFHLRRPLLEPPEGVLPEPEIHARLVEALGALPAAPVQALKAALQNGRAAFAMAFMEETQRDPALMAIAPVLLYRTLGERLPEGAASAAVLWGAAQMCAMRFGPSLLRAGFEGEGPALAEALFEAILRSPSGLVFSEDAPEESFSRVRTKGGKIQLAIPELLEELAGLQREPAQEPSAEFPLILSAGERRAFTANTIFRDPDWRKKDRRGALRISPEDAEQLGLADGAEARLVTKRGAARVMVEVSKRMMPGHVSLPNGQGLDNAEGEGLQRVGVAPNELTAKEDRDWLAGTPWHKNIPARLEALG